MMDRDSDAPGNGAPDGADDVLIRAAASGDVNTIRERVAAGAAIDGVGLEGWTALIHAVMNNQVEAVECLVALGADPNVETSGDEPSLVDVAANRGYAEVAWALLQAGAMDSVDGMDESRCPICARAILIGSADECEHWVLRWDPEFTWSSDAAGPLVEAAEDLERAVSDLEELGDTLASREGLGWIHQAYCGRRILSELLDRAGGAVATPYEASGYLIEWSGSDVFIADAAPTLQRAVMFARDLCAELAALKAEIEQEQDGE
jgi:hypothetical protein